MKRTAFLPALLITFLLVAGDPSSFREHCAKCHPRAPWVARDQAALDQFLSTHHAANPKVRGAIIEYLMGLSRE